MSSWNVLIAIPLIPLLAVVVTWWLRGRDGFPAKSQS